MKKYISIIAAVVAIIGCFIPWASVGGESFSGMNFGPAENAPGIVVISLSVLCAIFSFIIKKWSQIISILFSLLVVLLMVKYISDLKEFDELVSAGAGMYLILVAGIGIIVGNVMNMIGPKKTE